MSSEDWISTSNILEHSFLYNHQLYSWFILELWYNGYVDLLLTTTTYDLKEKEADLWRTYGSCYEATSWMEMWYRSRLCKELLCSGKSESTLYILILFIMPNKVNWDTNNWGSIIHIFPDGSYLSQWEKEELYLLSNGMGGVLDEYNNLEIQSRIVKDQMVADIYNRYFSKNKALRYNQGKLQWNLVHFPSLEPMVQVLEYGAAKYSTSDESGVGNWKKPMDKQQILNSAMRHLVQLMEDEELDSESKLTHVGHLMCNLMFYSYHAKNK